MGIPSHSFSTTKSATVHVLTPRGKVVAALVDAAKNPQDPAADRNHKACSLAAQMTADPIRARDDLVMAIRAFPRTETALQSLVASEGLTFWGEAIELVLHFCSTQPALAPLDGIFDDAPALLFARGGDNRGGFNSPRPSRAILAALSPWTLAWITSEAVCRNVAPAKLAAAILHRHARPVVAFLQASNRDA